MRSRWGSVSNMLAPATGRLAWPEGVMDTLQVAMVHRSFKVVAQLCGLAEALYLHPEVLRLRCIRSGPPRPTVGPRRDDSLVLDGPLQDTLNAVAGSWYTGSCPKRRRRT